MECPALLRVLIFVVIFKNFSAVKLSRPPHILIIVSDDQGWADVGYTQGVIPTPTIDALANEGVILSNFYVHPVCTPTRAALLTGRYAGLTGLTGPLLLGAPCALPDDVRTLGEELQTRGYHTILSGKWHLGHHTWAHAPIKKGFDEFWGVLNCCCAYTSKIYWHPLGGYAVDWREGERAVAPAPMEHSSASFARYMGDAAKRVVLNSPEKPLFMLLALTAPHSPLQPTPEHYARCAHVNTTRRRLFCGLMVSVDESIASVRASLEDAGVWDDTLVWYFNDNGANVWEGGRNYPYRGGKQSSFEGGSRATSFVRLPPALLADVPSPRKNDLADLMHVSDVMPTLLSLVDHSVESQLFWSLSGWIGGSGSGRWWQGEVAKTLNVTHWASGIGYDASSALLSEDPPNDATPRREDVLMAWDGPTNKLGYRYGKWKLVAGNPGSSEIYEEPRAWAPIGSTLTELASEALMHVQHWAAEDASGSLDEGVRELVASVGDCWAQLRSLVFMWRLPALEASAARPMLFDLVADPYESDDVAETHPEVVEMMLARVHTIEAGFQPSCNWPVIMS